MSSESSRAPLGRILTFYSYKGGTGRSMALANIAWLLASAGRRVLVIDWDLEAPGLHRYFGPFLIDEEVTGSEGLIDLVDDYSNAAIGPVDEGVFTDPDWFLPYTDFSKHVVTVNFRHFSKGGQIDFLPAGRQGEHYALAVSSFNWQNFYDRLGGGGFFEAFKQRAREKYDYVLIDSRTGVSDTAGICSVQMPDSLVVCFTYNNQSIKGAAAVARSAIATYKKLSDERLALRQSGKQSRFSPGLKDLGRGYRVFPVPMRVDEGESERLAIRQRFARKSFSDISPNLPPDYWLKVQVPYRVFYAYEEVLAPFKDEPGDPASVLHAQISLMGVITDGDVTDYRPLFSAEEKKKWQDAYAAVPEDAPAAAPKAAVESAMESEEELLVRKADVALASLGQPDQAIARRVLLRLVRISPAEEGSGYFPIRTRLNEFRDDEKRIAEVLAAQGVLTIASEHRSAEASIGIDQRILEDWPTLNRWLKEDADFLVWRQELRASLASWLRTGRDAGSLLSGRSLNEADLRALRREDDLSDGELEYIQQSRDAAAAVQSVLRSDVPLVAQVANEAPRAAAPSPRSTWIAAAVALIVIAAGGLWWVMRGSAPNDSVAVSPMVRIPKFDGLTSEEARTLAAQNRLRLVMNDGSSGDQEFIANVVVVSQTPAFDVLAPAMDPVRLSVAAATVTVPQVAGADIRQTLLLLAESGLKPGATEYRYVPNATVGQVASQKPDGGAIVPPGTLVDIVVARSPKLNEVQIAVYYLEPEGQLATAINTYLKRRGFQSTLFLREMRFFEGFGVSRANQIRYSSASEITLKDELAQLLKEGGFGEFKAAFTRNTPDGFISVFLAVGPKASGK